VPILDKNGRPWSTRTKEEEEDLLTQDISNLSEEEQIALLEILEKVYGGDQKPLRGLMEADYSRVPVDVRTFLMDPYFLGHVGKSLWPQLVDDMVELFEGQYQEGVLGGCLALDTIIQGSNGSLRTLGERMGESPRVLAIADQRGVVAANSERVVHSGVQRVVEVVLSGGHRIRLTPDHRLRVHSDESGYAWKCAGELSRNDMVVCVGKAETSPDSNLSADEAKLLAYWCADGSSDKYRARFCDGNLATCEDVVRLLRKLGFDGKISTKGNAWEVNVKRATKSGFLEFLRKHGADAKTHDVRVPDSVCRASNDVVASFLNALWACEGCVYSNIKTPKLTLCMTSGTFVNQVSSLLLRFGVHSNVYPVEWKNGSSGVQLSICAKEMIQVFMNEIGHILGKEDRSRRLVEIVESRNGQRRVKWLSKTTIARKVKSVTELSEPIEVGDVMNVCDAGYRFIGMQISCQNSIGWGKSFFASTAMAYVIYQMSCLRNPQLAYGIDQGSKLYVAMLSVTEKVARRVSVAEFIGKVQYSPYFQEHFPFKAAPSNLDIRFPNDIWVVAGSTCSSAIIGLNVFSGFIDETSFMGESKDVDRMGNAISLDVGEQIHRSIIRRMKSRFQRVGRLPGVLLTVSSKERPSAFIEKHIKAAREIGDPNFFVREYATWDVKPKEFFSTHTFKVAAGTDKVQSRILTDDDPEEEARCVDKGMQIISVPVDYRDDFERDIDSALRDIAGIATEMVSPYMSRIDKIFDSVRESLPVTVGAEGESRFEWVANRMLTINWGNIVDEYERRLPGGYREKAYRPKRHPGAVRYVHIDPSLTGDCTGIVIAHVAGWVEVERRDAIGEEYNEIAPVIETDLILRVIPPPGDEILMSDVRSIVYQFQEHGFGISYVSMDSYQSADAIQQLKRRGIEAEVVSVDRTNDAYETLKTAFYEKRIRLHDHPHMLCELRSLQRMPQGRGRMKVDHPSKMTGPSGTLVKGSKDVADSLAAVTFSLTQKMPGRPVSPTMGLTDATVGEKQDDSWVSGGKLMVDSSHGRIPGSGSTAPNVVSQDTGTRVRRPLIKG